MAQNQSSDSRGSFISKALSATRKRLIRPWANQTKRALAARLNWEQTIVVDRFGEFRFRMANRTEVFRTADFGHEPIALAALLFLLRSEDIVWDVGASVGLYAVHMAARAARVVAFEPDPTTAARLRENLEINGLAERAEINQLAIGDTPGELELATDGLSGFAPVLSTAKLGRHSRTVKVRVETIDDLITEGKPAPDVIKVDIEGAEILALKGGKRLLSAKDRPRLIFMEVHPAFLPNFDSTHEEVDKIIRDYGYLAINTQSRDAQVHLLAVRRD